MRRKTVLLLVVWLLTWTLGGCQGESTKPAATKSRTQNVRIGLSFDTFVLERWLRDRDVFVSTAEKLGASVDVQNANGSVAKQIDQLENFIAQKVDAIVIVAVDCYALSAVVKTARDQGISVIAYDRLIQGAVTDLFITVDSTLVGREMAGDICTRLPEGGNVVMICGPQSDTNSYDIIQGFKAELDEKKWPVIYQNHVKSWTPENGFAAVTEAFENAEDIDAVMCGNDGLAGYAIKALSEMQRAGEVIVVGQDADLEACQRVVEGTQSMTVYKPIEDLAKRAAEYTVRLAGGTAAAELGAEIGSKTLENGSKVAFCGLKPVAVRRDNMDAVIIDSGFHLREEVYLNVGN